MAERPYTLLSCSMSIDGYIDDASEKRLLLSNMADFDRVDAVRASCDAILVGAATIRVDDPHLLVRTEARRAERVARGLPPSPTKVTVTDCGELDARAKFFAGDAEKLVYCASAHVREARDRFESLATVVDAGEHVGMRGVSEDLYARGVRRLMVEGGERIHTQFLSRGLADELQLVVAPFFVGDSRAPRLVSDESFPWTPDSRARLVDTRTLDDVVLLRYALSPRFNDEDSTR